jgi:hypothetical protein
VAKQKKQTTAQARQAEALKALAHPLRISILRHLKEADGGVPE